ncbi:caspase family protein [Streptomyces sp. NPDC059851]|uniref:caspase family protein n=1 Tax=Streptomyces sp. NPDC059851 TaxID=3346971 RepID=UPI003664C458
MTDPIAPDPARVHAVVVGIEHFKHVEGLDLPGAAADAMRFARWLRMRGVPKENITLLLTPLGESWAALNEQAGQLDLAITFAGSRDVIMNSLAPKSRADVPEGDVLYVYWGGHGVLGRGERRLLLCPDATNQDPRCIDLTDLREHLSRPDVAGYRRQMFLVDACATFIENRKQVAAPTVASFPAGQRAAVEQFMLLAAAAGQATVQSRKDRAGVFSAAVLDWLERHSPSLDPDLGALVAHVKEHFAGRGLGRRPVQTPVTWVVRSFGGDTEEIAPGPAGEGPGPGTQAPATAAVVAASRSVGRRRALARGGIAAAAVVVAAVAAVALKGLPGGGGGGEDGKPAAAASGAAAGASGYASAPPAVSASASPPPSTAGSGSPSAAPGTPPSSVQAAAPACASAQGTYAGPHVTATPCYVLDGTKVTMVAEVAATVPTDVTVYLWLSTKADNKYLYPAGKPVNWSFKADPTAQRLTEQVDMPLTSGTSYAVHVFVTRKGDNPPKAVTNRDVTGTSQWFRYP